MIKSILRDLNNVFDEKPLLIKMIRNNLIITKSSDSGCILNDGETICKLFKMLKEYSEMDIISTYIINENKIEVTLVNVIFDNDGDDDE